MYVYTGPSFVVARPMALFLCGAPHHFKKCRGPFFAFSLYNVLYKQLYLLSYYKFREPEFQKHLDTTFRPKYYNLDTVSPCMCNVFMLNNY